MPFHQPVAEWADVGFLPKKPPRTTKALVKPAGKADVFATDEGVMEI